MGSSHGPWDAATEGFTVDVPPWRVASLAPHLTETLLDLDLGDRLIAVTDACAGPAMGVQSWVRIGGARQPDIDAIVALGPDLALLSADDNRQQDADALRSAGLSVWVIGPRTVFDTLNLLWDLMRVFDHAVMVPRVRELERAAEYTEAAAAGTTPVRVFAPLVRGDWTTFNRETYAHDVLRVCGGRNVFGDRAARYPTVTSAEVEDAQPDVVLLPDDPVLFSEADIDIIRALDIPAAAHDRFYRLDHTLLTWQGTRLAFALRDLPPLLVGDGE